MAGLFSLSSSILFSIPSNIVIHNFVCKVGESIAINIIVDIFNNIVNNNVVIVRNVIVHDIVIII